MGRRKNPAASVPEPCAAFKGVGVRGGRGREAAGTICTCLLYSSPHLYTEQGWCAPCSNESKGGAFWGAVLLCVDAETQFLSSEICSARGTSCVLFICVRY